MVFFSGMIPGSLITLQWMAPTCGYVGSTYGTQWIIYKYMKKRKEDLGVVAHNFNSNPRKAEAGESGPA